MKLWRQKIALLDCRFGDPVARDACKKAKSREP